MVLTWLLFYLGTEQRGTMNTHHSLGHESLAWLGVTAQDTASKTGTDSQASFQSDVTCSSNIH